jgi:hypothetical protein
MFTLFTSKDLKRAMMPASMIRVAGDPDYFHKRSIESVHCTTGSDEAGNDIPARRDASAVMEHSRLDLFAHVGNQKLVIR